jgi:aminopeptidase N
VARRRTVRTGLVAAAAALSAIATAAVLASLPADAVVASAVAGAPGIGDPYYPKDGNGGYDVKKYVVDVSYSVDSGELTGTTEVHARAKQNLDSLNLDLVLGVTDVTVAVGAGHPGALTRGTARNTWHQDGAHELVVKPPSAIPAGTPFKVTVTYGGNPKQISWAGENPWVSSRTEAMATNEPHVAPWWFPANDHPRDKAAFDVTVSVPVGNQAISNGQLVSRSEDATSSTWHWQMAQPMATYLAFFAAGKFVIDEGNANGLHYYNAVSKGLSPSQQTVALKLMRRSPGIVRWLETQFGKYPFGTWTGGVTTSLSAGFALENQGRPTYPYLGNNGYSRSVVVHELAHQWLGDLVSVNRWSDIWLNEGFAQWTEWRYTEAHGGWRAQRTMRRHYSSYLPSDGFWKLTVGDPGRKKLFAYPVYERGAMAVQALRHRIGSQDFERVLRLWVKQHADGTARIGQFRRLAEQVSGQKLGRFFTVWLFTPERPARTKANGLR